MATDLQTIDWDEVVEIGPLSREEQVDLDGLLREGRDCLAALGRSGIRFGEILIEIHQRKLFREHGNLKALVIKEFGRTRQWAYSHITLCQVTANIAKTLNVFGAELTHRESQALAKIPAEMQETAYRMASASGPADAAKIKEAKAIIDKLLAGEPLTQDELSGIAAANAALEAGPGQDRERTGRKHRTPLEALVYLSGQLQAKLNQPQVLEAVPPAEAAAIALRPLEGLLKANPAGVGRCVLSWLQERAPSALGPVVGARLQHVLGEAIGHGRESA